MKAKTIITSAKKSYSLPGTLFFKNNNLNISNYSDLSDDFKKIIQDELKKTGIDIQDEHIVNKDLIIPRYSEPTPEFPKGINRATIIGELIGKHNIQTGRVQKSIAKRKHNEPLDFERIKNDAKIFADYLISHTEEITTALSVYECHNVAQDEIERAVDLLSNIDKNAEYFQIRAGGVTTFLPINQPLYATVCFGIIPSLMASDVAIRVPIDMQVAYKQLQSVINFSNFFSNMHISYESREEFIAQRKPVTETVIFTGRPENGMLIKKEFKPDVLFIINGSGHNPIVISDNANIDSAVESTIRVCLQNQGQDCAAPNAILVKNSELVAYKNKLLEKLVIMSAFIGPYTDRKNIIGPNTRPEHVLKIAEFLYKIKKYHIYGGNINPCSGMIEPCVIEKPLQDGANFEEFFAPIIMIQPYEHDEDLSNYFEKPQYKSNAMYVTIFGDSVYINTLIKKGLHTPENIIHNTDLHHTERGFLPYGGTGWAASSIHFNGHIIHGATLPQRDIYLYNIKNVSLSPEPISLVNTVEESSASSSNSHAF